MPFTRRHLLRSATALLPAAVVPASLAAMAAAEDVLAPLGLDPYTVYRQMFSSTANNAECCWWYLGTSKLEVADIGFVPVDQVETIMVYKTEDVGKDAVNVYWKEIGAFRDIATGELPAPWPSPVTGQPVPRRKSFEDGPAHYTIHKAPGGVAIDLDQIHASVKSVKATFSVANGQLCITQVEDKTRGIDTANPIVIQTILKIYAPLAGLRNASIPSVPCSGFYRAGALGPGYASFNVNGLMRKAAVDEKLNPIGWDRMKQAYPDFFKGDRVAPSWK